MEFFMGNGAYVWVAYGLTLAAMALEVAVLLSSGRSSGVEKGPGVERDPVRRGRR
jgi:hypothetical protein